ncbi:MAG TPA: hypothetical protein VME46_25490 [Acidimicrobiales bacterium]|nr:hypothetical protein [Acidimicrobiales bacterium]
MANTRWLDRSQPQTLLYATMLLYFDAGWWVLSLLLGGIAFFFPLLAIPAVLAGLGIANEKKLGYVGGILVAALNLAMLVFLFWAVQGQSISIIISLIFGAALLALLVHPMSRSYQAIWFKKLDRRGGGRRR